MAIITKAELTSLASRNVGYRSFSAVANEAKLQNKSSASVTIFLSHSHYDQYEVEQAVVFLRSLGIVLYVDWQDDNMPAHTSGVTAARIKQKIIENKKFILLATNTAIASKWCNWELGFGDAKKYIDHIALFPIADTAGNWKGNEYLQIYPRIERNDAYIGYDVIFPGGKSMKLEQWLRS